MSSPLNTTTTRATGRAFVAAIVGALLAWGATKWGKFNTGTFAALTPVASGLSTQQLLLLRRSTLTLVGCLVHFLSLRHLL